MPETIRTYRTRPIEVQAIRFDGTNHAAVQAFTNDRFDAVDPRDRGDDPDAVAAVYGGVHSATLPARIGDWVVRDEDGVFEVFTDSAFHAEFEAVGDAKATIYAWGRGTDTDLATGNIEIPIKRDSDQAGYVGYMRLSPAEATSLWRMLSEEVGRA